MLNSLLIFKKFLEKRKIRGRQICLTCHYSRGNKFVDSQLEICQRRGKPSQKCYFKSWRYPYWTCIWNQSHPCCFQVGMYVCSFKHGNAIYIYTYIVLFFSFNRMLTSYPSGRVCNTGRRRWFRQLYDHGRITSLPRHWNAPEIGNGIMIWKLKGHLCLDCVKIS